MALVRNSDLKCFWLNYDKLSSNYDKISFTPPLPYVHQFTDTMWIVPTVIQQWVVENIREEAQRPHQPKSIIIEGPSRIGKTYWARSLGPQNYYLGYIDLRDDNDDAIYNIIDDVAPQYLKHWREFIRAQWDFFSNFLHSRPAFVRQNQSRRGIAMRRRMTNAGRYSTSNAAARYSIRTDVSNHIHWREKMLSGIFYDTLRNPIWFRAVDMSMPGNQGVYKIECLFNYNLRKALGVRTFTSTMYAWLTYSGRKSLTENVFTRDTG
ncbi:unnamed protein product [Camellia sinensis]